MPKNFRVTLTIFLMAVLTIGILILVWSEPDGKAVTKRSAIPKSGYLLQNLKTTPVGNGRIATYSIQANPVISTGITRTGNDAFFMDDTGVIRHSGHPAKPAQSTDQPVQ